MFDTVSCIVDSPHLGRGPGATIPEFLFFAGYEYFYYPTPARLFQQEHHFITS